MQAQCLVLYSAICNSFLRISVFLFVHFTRSPGTGLYDNLQQYRIPYPEAIFDLTYFRSDQAPFFALAKALYPTGRTYRPNIAHYFLRLMHEKGLLLRIYTQNIDGLERRTSPSCFDCY